MMTSDVEEVPLCPSSVSGAGTGAGEGSDGEGTVGVDVAGSLCI